MYGTRNVAVIKEKREPPFCYTVVLVQLYDSTTVLILYVHFFLNWGVGCCVFLPGIFGPDL